MQKPVLAAVLAMSITLLGTASIAQTNMAGSAGTGATGTTPVGGVNTGFTAPQKSTMTSQNTTQMPKGWSSTNVSTGTLSVPPPPVGKNATPATSTTKTTTSTKEDSYTLSADSLTSPGPNWTQTVTNITPQPGQEQFKNLTLVFTNGSGEQALKGIRIKLNNKALASEKDFAAGTFTANVAGALSPGDNPLNIQSFGPSGATLSWKLTTYRPVLTTAAPDTVKPGDVLTLTGRNFGRFNNLNTVLIGNKQALVQTSTSKQIQAIVPKGLDSGDNNVAVSVAGVKTKQLKIKVKNDPPVLESCDMYQTPPNMPITISGKNFSEKAAENVVTIGGMNAQVLNASQTSLTVMVPDMDPNLCGIEKSRIQVTTNGLQSKGDVGVLVRTGLQKPYDGTQGWPNF